MTCSEFADFLSDYLSGELPAATRAEFDRHLGVCSNCRTYLASYKSTADLGRRAFEDQDAEVPSDVPPDLIKAILESRKR
jgi:anti-sigma factor RsiW